MTALNAERQLVDVDRVCVVHPVTDWRWADLVDRAPAATIFHHPLWLRLIRNCYRYPIWAVCLTDSAGRLLAGIPIATVSSWITGRRLVSIPFSDICEPLAIEPGDEQELIAALDAERCRLDLPLEIHADVPALPNSGVSERFYHHVVPIRSDGERLIETDVRGAKRRGDARALRLGVRVSQRFDLDALDEFFRMHVLTRHKHGIPAQPKRLFRWLVPLLDQKLAFVLLLEWRSRAVAAGIFLRHRDTLTYKYRASDPAHLDKHPNDLMMLEALRIGHALGCSTLDLGLTEFDNEVLRRVKREYGAQERTLVYTMSPPLAHRHSIRRVPRLERALIRRTPPSVGRLLGASIYRHFG